MTGRSSPWVSIARDASQYSLEDPVGLPPDRRGMGDLEYGLRIGIDLVDLHFALDGAEVRAAVSKARASWGRADRRSLGGRG